MPANVSVFDRTCMHRVIDPVEKERARPAAARDPDHLGAPAREAAEPEPERPDERRPAERKEPARRHESPIRTAEQEMPAEVRPPTPDEDLEDLEDLDDPPPAEGPREDE